MGAKNSNKAGGRSLEEFITYWQGQEGGQERANYQLFLIELAEALGLPRPDAAGPDTEKNRYVFERAVTFRAPDGTTSTGRIDLYRRGCFVLEAKQSRMKGQKKAIPGQTDLFVPDAEPRGERNASRAWDVLMLNARRQAEDYARALPVDDGWPPFVLVVDVGHCIELFADFSGQGKNYAQFPDRQSYRIYLEDLRDPDVADRLRLVWNDPQKLDPAKQSAKVTREIAERLAQVSKALEERKHSAEDVALFLMRCLFTMFAEDVELLPKTSFKDLLAKCVADETKFVRLVEQLWQAMDKGDFAFALEQKVLRFNGKLFKNAKALALKREDIGELLVAAKADWRQVEPAIFGTLLEQALDVKERARLGAHYTPRAFVERLVVATIIEPLREDWLIAQATAERHRQEADALHEKTEARAQRLKTKDQKELDSIRDARGDAKRMRQQVFDTIVGFHKKLCSTRVLDPACGTGNFLYVSMEMIKRLEGEVLEALVSLGGQEALALDKDTVDPHQFLGIEKNTRAAAIAELVIWLGYLQWHFRTRGGVPSEPILRDFKNIECRDAVLEWDGAPLVQSSTIDGKSIEIYINPRQPAWPEAEFIVGNPPFIGKGEPMRSALGDAYLKALWEAHPNINESADFVMFWWDRSATLVAAAKSKVRRCGLVTTNSITQAFNRRTLERHRAAKRPVTILLAIPDHPWTKATDNAAAVRIAMTVFAAGHSTGEVRTVIAESGLQTDQPDIQFSATRGTINSDLSIGADVTSLQQLRANKGLCTPGMQLSGQGFIIEGPEYDNLKGQYGAKLDSIVKPYSNGRQLIQGRWPQYVIDAHPRSAEEVRAQFPHVYQILLDRVKPERDRNNRESYRKNWWVFAEPRKEFRAAFDGLPRYIATSRTAKHRVFTFVPGRLVSESKVIAVAADEALVLGVLSSRFHVVFSLKAGGWLGVGNDPTYNHSDCFDPFPFPDAGLQELGEIRAIAEELDAHRKSRQAQHPDLTLTDMYNVLEKLRAGTDLDDEEKRIKDQGLVLMLKEFHDRLDVAVARAYGWAADVSEEQILELLVKLNAKRAAEESMGKVLWLRPDLQVPRFGSDAEKARWLEGQQHRQADPNYVPPGEAGIRPAQGVLGLPDELQELMPRDDDAMKPRFPTNDEIAETAAVMFALGSSMRPMSATEVARYFKGGRQHERRVKLVIDALSRLGHVGSTDGGQSFQLRREMAMSE